jgi:hypothetical protein
MMLAKSWDVLFECIFLWCGCFSIEALMVVYQVMEIVLEIKDTQENRTKQIMLEIKEVQLLKKIGHNKLCFDGLIERWHVFLIQLFELIVGILVFLCCVMVFVPS